jgi:hypothetical protein
MHCRDAMVVRKNRRSFGFCQKLTDKKLPAFIKLGPTGSIGFQQN